MFHSGIFGPVHTGILSGIQLFGALRLQRRLESYSTTSATGPSRCVPPPCGTTAQPNSGAPPPAGSSALFLTSSRFRPVRARPPATVCGFPFFANCATYTTSPAMSSRAAGWVSPVATSVPFGVVHGSPSTLRGLLHLLGQSGGFQAATTGLLGDPKNKEFMTIVPEAIDELQLLNRRRVFEACNSRVHPEMENRCRGCDPGTEQSPEGATDTRMGVSAWEVFSGIFLLYCLALVSSPPAFIVYAGSSSVFLLLSRWSVTALSVLLVVWTCAAYTNSGRKGAI